MRLTFEERPGPTTVEGDQSREVRQPLLVNLEILGGEEMGPIRCAEIVNAVHTALDEICTGEILVVTDEGDLFPTP